MSFRKVGPGLGYALLALGSDMVTCTIKDMYKTSNWEGRKQLTEQPPLLLSVPRNFIPAVAFSPPRCSLG